MLAAIALVQQPGRIIGDTKADLVLNPGGFLARATQLWDPNGAFGQVQNQAYGYLFPMGPLFWLGDVLGNPDWVTQRLWWALIFIVAFLGMVKLCAVLGLGLPAARLVGGFAFALSPRMLTVIGPSSIEVWPLALAPWVLVPLVIGLKRGNPRYMAALSAIAVSCVGGVNAAATFAVIPLGAMWLVMAAPNPRRRQMIIFWPLFVAMGTLWWLIPLFLLGSASPPFLDFIESASTTTFVATVFDSLRGTTNWIPYLDNQSVAGNALLTNSTFILNSAVVVALGLVGVARKDNVHRKFLLSAIVIGLALVTLGHAGAGLGTSGIQAMLDGALAPLRNTHKFDPVIRVPLVLGLVHLISVAGSRVSPKRSGLTFRSGVAVLAAAAVLGSTVPAWTAQLPNRGSYLAVPGYWTEATDWLNENAQSQNSLLLPGSAFGEYLWGSPRDEVIQSFANSPWSVRNAVPLAPGGSIRMLDAIESSFGSGRGSSELTAFLQRSGIRYLVVRSDLAGDGRSTDSELVYSTIASLPDVKAVRSFGPRVGNPATQETEEGETVFVNRGRQTTHPAVEIFEVSGVDSAQPRVQDLTETPVVAGSPGALIPLGASISGQTATLLAGDVPKGMRPENVVLTDTNRRQEVAFGRVVDNRSASLAKADRYRIDRPVHDYALPGRSSWQTVPQLVGAKRIRASSSKSDVTARSIDQSRQPWSAFDGDPATQWTADPGANESTAWLEIEFETPVSANGMKVHLSAGQPNRVVTVTTDAGSRKTKVTANKESTLRVAPGLTRRVRVAAPSTGFDPLSIDDIAIPEAQLSRPLRLPDVPESWGTPREILLTMAAGPPRCFVVDEVTRCQPGQDGLGEDGNTLDRRFALSQPRSYGAAARVVPTGSPALADHFSGELGLATSSTANSDPSVGILAAVDSNPKTGWISSLGDVTPTLTLSFKRERELSEITLATDASLAASAPRRAELLFDNGEKRTVRFDVAGRAKFSPVEAKQVKIEVTDAYVRSSLSSDGTGSGMQLGVSEIRLQNDEIASDVRPAEEHALPCGSGPTIDVGGREIQTSISASLHEILTRRTVVASLCGEKAIALAKGENRITVSSSRAFRVDTLQLGDADAREASGEPVQVKSRTRGELATEPIDGNGRRLLSLSQNFNSAWHAGDGTRAMTVDGWMQGWLVEAGSSVDAKFSLSRVYHGGLVIGLLAFLALVLTVGRLRRTTFLPQTMVGPSRQGLRTAIGVALGAGLTLLVAGWSGALVAVVTIGVALAWNRRWSSVWMVGTGVIVAAVGYYMKPWNSPSGWAGSDLWPQLAVVFSLAAAVSTVFEEPILRLLNRIMGFSTSR